MIGLLNLGPCLALELDATTGGERCDRAAVVGDEELRVGLAPKQRLDDPDVQAGQDRVSDLLEVGAVRHLALRGLHEAVLDHERQAITNVVVAALGDLLRHESGHTLLRHGAHERVVEICDFFGMVGRTCPYGRVSLRKNHPSQNFQKAKKKSVDPKILLVSKTDLPIYRFFFGVSDF